MKFIPYEIRSGKENMQIDFDLLEQSIKYNLKEPFFRLYGWSPACVSLGRNQKDDFLDLDFLNSMNINVVRRLTGGRALLHNDEITYCFVCPVSLLKNGENIVQSYKEISKILINVLKQTGIELDFGGNKKVNVHQDYCMLLSTGADLCYNGKKLIGSAQFRKQDYILQHGSILFDYNIELLEKIFKQKVDTSSITSIKEINPALSKNDIIELLSNVKFPLNT